MKLSIITISYNNLSGLKKTAQSILVQDWKDYEWIVIDGGSNDGTKEFLEQLTPQPDYWCSEKDNGIYDAQNKGIMRAKGEYVCCMNAGDSFFEPSTLRSVLKYCPNADVVYGDWMRVYSDREEIRYSPKKMPPHFFFYDNICHQAMFVKTQLLQKDAFDLSFQIYADWAKWRQLMYEGCTFEYVPVIVCNFEADAGVSQRNISQCEVEYKRLTDEMPTDVRNILYSPCINEKEYNRLKAKHVKHIKVIRLMSIAMIIMLIMIIVLFVA